MTKEREQRQLKAAGDFPGRDRLMRRYVEARKRLAGALVE